MKKLLLTIALSVCLFTPVLGETLPGGFVKGLPQNIIVTDENGIAPEDGEIYILIENMVPYEVYEKDITVLNARDDAEYAIYMTSNLNYTEGNIDLLGETDCKLYLDGKLIYTGLVNGDGNPNMQTSGLNLGGRLESGEKRKLHAEFVWNPPNEPFTGSGEVSFIWTFYAAIPKPSSGHKYYPEGNIDTSEGKKKSDPFPDWRNPDTHDTPDHSTPDDTHPHTETTEESVEETTEGIIEKLIDKTPLIPEDVKTGYKSRLVFYAKLFLAALSAAILILAVITAKIIKLRRLQKNKTCQEV